MMFKNRDNVLVINQWRITAMVAVLCMLFSVNLSQKIFCAEKNQNQVTVVNVQQSGKWVVGLNDTPTVKLSSPVVANTVQAQAADAGIPFVKSISFNIENGTTQNNVPIVIPDGKRLVIEYVSARAQGPAGQRFIAQLQTNVAKAENPRGIFWLVFFPQGTFSSVDVYTASQPMHIYSEPGNLPLLFVATRTGITGSAFVEATISGHLINIK
jgi:hypothetical protein